MKSSKIIAAVLSLAVLVLLAGVAEACPTCKDQMAADPAAANIARGYFWSILFMLSMPILILTGLGSYFYWEVRRAYARQAIEDALQADEPRPAVPQS
jgi:heme/copper-type cytochrome/quinol oxidase subunit 2